MTTDRRDARTPPDACRLGAYRPAHRTSAGQREVRAQLAVREALVRPRVRYLAVIRAVLRRAGIAVPIGSAATVVQRLDAVTVPAAPAALIAPRRELLGAVTAAMPPPMRASGGWSRRIPSPSA